MSAFGKRFHKVAARKVTTVAERTRPGFQGVTTEKTLFNVYAASTVPSLRLLWSDK